jgi:uncharacterized repeat protein (TIGR01451 family)
MKKLITILNLLLFPFLLLLRLSSSHKDRVTHSQKYSQKKKKQILLVILSSLFLTSLAWAAASNNPDISIEPTAKEITEGTASVELAVTLSEAGNKGAIEVNYIDNCNGSSSTVTISQGSTTVPITIDTSTLTGGTSCTVILDSASGSGGQKIGNIAPDTSTITVVAAPTTPISDLKITKTGSADIVTVNRDFYYTIDLTNEGNETVTNVVVVDTLPNEMTTALVDIDATNNDSPYWDCSVTGAREVTCEHNTSGIPFGETHSIILHLTAPSISAEMTNEVTVTNTTDINSTSTSNSASEITTITNEVDNADDLCYIVNTPIEDNAGDCLQEGNFYYGNGCISSITIVDTNVTDEDLTALVVTKMYAPSLDHGSAVTTLGTIRGGGISTLAITEYTSYTEGYIVDIEDALVSDANFTLTDTNSYNNGNKMYGIALYADYNISDEHHTGRIYACTGGEGGIEILSAGDVIDTPITSANAANYNASSVPNQSSTDLKYIQTMIAGDTTREIAGVYLNLDGDTEIYTYTGEVQGNNDPLPFQLTPLWADSTCSTAYGNVLDAAGNRLVLEVPSGSYSSQKVAITVPNYARKDYRMQMIVVDPNSLSVEGQNCLDNSSTSGNFDQLAQCVNSEVHYKTAFGQDAWDRCGIDGGAPCESNNHGSADPSDPSYDPATDYIYTNPLGCYMCTFNIQPSCSTDNFAIRPKAFDVNISDGDTFVSGEMNNLKFEALNANDASPTYDYNETENTSFSVDINITDPSKTCPTKIELNPSVEFIDGIDTDDFFFNDVGKDLNFTVQEINGSEYALVDADDSNDTVRLITPFERNISVIPDRFIIEGNLTDHNTDHNFTYLHDINKYDLDDNYSMGAALTIDIKAVGADDNITRNYMETCYAEDTNVTLSLGSTDITYPGAVPLTHFLYYNPAEDNGTADSGEGNYTLPAPVGNTISFTSLPIENIPSTFSADAPDGNGTAYIEYKLNFDRQQHLLVNPFKLVLSDVNITDTDGVEGTDNVNQNATLQYARSRSSQFFYEDIDDQNVLTPIMIDIYCDLGFTACDSLSIDTVNGQINEVNWWLSLGHDIDNDDGNITLMEGAVTEGNSTDWSVTPAVNIITDTATDPNIVVDRGTNPTLPLTVEIELDETNSRNTDHWLIYNPNYPMPLSPFYKVRFIGTSGWAGHGDTGHVVDSNTSVKKNRRLGW